MDGDHIQGRDPGVRGDKHKLWLSPSKAAARNTRSSRRTDHGAAEQAPRQGKQRPFSLGSRTQSPG